MLDCGKVLRVMLCGLTRCSVEGETKVDTQLLIILLGPLSGEDGSCSTLVHG
jgi:hypothetical protein